ncbi:MAG: hypothetical protein WAU31_00985 [Candidatus Moraniibacteriota bacterium]
MSHLAYIDPDEEIISVISRLRKASEADVFFVVPKRALFVRSLVNLRLLEREAKKLGKHLCLVTPDEEGQSLAQKAGIESRGSLEGIPGINQSAKPSLPARLPRSQSGQFPASEQLVSPPSGSRLHSESIGSSSFFAVNGPGADVTPCPVDENPTPLPRPVVPLHLPDSNTIAATPTPRSVPVRDRTPKRLTALNSVSNAPSSPSPELPPVEPPSRSNISQKPGGVNRMPERTLSSKPASDAASRVSFTFPAPTTPLSPSPLQSAPQSLNNEQFSPSPGSALPQQTPSPDQGALSRFYRKDTPPQSVGATASADASSQRHSDSRAFRWILLGGGALSLLAALGVAIVIFVPRADVTVIAKELSTSLDVEISARVDQESVDVSGKYIPLRVVEAEKDIVQSFPSTGQASVSDKRARGMITISNTFGSSPQSLVATTRFESPDGKIFRLAKGVTIPGTKEVDGKTIPGTIDVEVVADASGKEYNIDSTTFTIPGLKGGPKYEKISASSVHAFSGGGEGEGAVASVSADDVARAKDAALKALSESLRNELEKDLQPGEKLLDDAILSETLSSDAFPSVGAVASSFDFRIHVSARALVFSESDVRTVAAALLGEGAKPEDVHVEYTIPHPDFTAKMLGIKARVSFEKGQKMDIERIKESILGKSVGDVQAVFADYPNIQKIEVVFWPKFMTSRIPSRASQVSVHVETATGGM